MPPANTTHSASESTNPQAPEAGSSGPAPAPPAPEDHGPGRRGRFVPELLDKVERVLRFNPTVSTKRLARDVGCNEKTAARYRVLFEADAKKLAAAKESELATTKEGLIHRVAERIRELESKICGLLEPEPGETFLSRNRAETAFRGYAILEKYYRLQKEFIAEATPTTINVVLSAVQSFLAQFGGDATKLPPEFLDAWARARAEAEARYGKSAAGAAAVDSVGAATVAPVPRGDPHAPSSHTVDVTTQPARAGAQATP